MNSLLGVTSFDQQARLGGEPAPILIAMVPRERGITGVHTHVRQLTGYLRRAGLRHEVVTPHSWGTRPYGWGRAVIGPLFALRLLLERVSGPMNVLWYRFSHELFLRAALRRRLATAGPCVIYAQCPVSASAALRARRGPHQRVVLAVHFRISQADEWADKGQIGPGSRVYRQIRGLERDVVPRTDGLVYVSAWARAALTGWLPAADTVPWAVIDNFVSAPEQTAAPQRLGDLVTIGNLEAIKNHRYLVQILDAARTAGHELTLDVYGEGVEQQNLAAQATALGLSSQVRLLGFRDDVRGRLPGYRAYVHASYSESSSLAIIEAMAAGLPIVAGDTGPLTELYDDGVEGRLWPLDDPARAAGILLEVLAEPAREQASAAALRRFHRDFDAAVVAPQLVRFLEGGSGETVGRSGRGAKTPGPEHV